jgi:hypothetical protein
LAFQEVHIKGDINSVELAIGVDITGREKLHLWPGTIEANKGRRWTISLEVVDSISDVNTVSLAGVINITGDI